MTSAHERAVEAHGGLDPYDNMAEIVRRRPITRPALEAVRQGMARDFVARLRAALRRECPALPVGERPGASACGCDPRTTRGVLEVLGDTRHLAADDYDRIGERWRAALAGTHLTVLLGDGIRLRRRPLVCTCGDRRHPNHESES